MFALLKKKISEVEEKTKAFLKGEVVLDKKKLDELFSGFELALLESDVALGVSEKIIEDLKKSLHGKKIKQGKVDNLIREVLRKSLKEIFPPKPEKLVELVKNKVEKPYIIAFVGVNGTGKTTTIAKIVHLLQEDNLNCILAASDTFRAGAIEQLEKHAAKLGARLVRHGKGADAAAVAYDAIEHAKAHGKDAVLIDTAGRMETNVNLLDEMKKVARVTKPDLVLFIGDALTGNAAIEQAERFNSAVPIDGIILTKADADAKGGSAISIAYAIKKPIFFLGTGQSYDDLVEFDAEELINEILG